MSENPSAHPLTVNPERPVPPSKVGGWGALSGQKHLISTYQNRRNWLFAGSYSGGDRAAAMYFILQTAKLNGVNPEAYLIDTLYRIAAGHPISRISELMPGAFGSPPRDPAA